MSSNPNDYYFSQETGTQIPLNPVVRGLSTIQEAYASSSQSQSQSQSTNSQQMSVASAIKEGMDEGEDGASKKMDDSFNHNVEDYYDHDPVNDLWLQEQGLL